MVSPTRPLEEFWGVWSFFSLLGTILPSNGWWYWVIEDVDDVDGNHGNHDMKSPNSQVPNHEWTGPVRVWSLDIHWCNNCMLCQTQAESWTSIFGGVMVLQREACGKSLSLRVILGEDYWRTSHFWSDLPVEGTKLYHFGIPTQCRSNRLLLSWMNPWIMWCGIPARLVQLFPWKTWWWVFYFRALRVIPKNQLHLVGAFNFSSILMLGKDWN